MTSTPSFDSCQTQAMANDTMKDENALRLFIKNDTEQFVHLFFKDEQNQDKCLRLRIEEL